MYLITFAAGFLGKVSDSVVELLRGNGEQVRAMVRRDDARANRFRDLGAEVMVADLTSPADVVRITSTPRPTVAMMVSTPCTTSLTAVLFANSRGGPGDGERRRRHNRDEVDERFKTDPHNLRAGVADREEHDADHEDQQAEQPGRCAVELLGVADILNGSIITTGPVLGSILYAEVADAFHL